MPTTRRALAVGIALLASIGGSYVAVADDATGTATEPSTAQADDEATQGNDEDASTQAEDGEGEMTVERSESTDEGTREGAPPFYATRVVEVEGALTLDELPIELATQDGTVDVRTGEDDTYALEATLTGHGYTPQDARDQRDRLSLDLDVGEPGDRHLFAEVEKEPAQEQVDQVRVDRGGAVGDLALVVPENLVATLAAASTNGDLNVADVTASALEASSTNGDVSLDDVVAEQVWASSTNGDVDAGLAGTREVDLSSTNGDVDATVHPGATGSLEASSTNGHTTIHVPEDAGNGYDADASSTNGEVRIELEDGSTRSDDEEHGSEEARFLTDGFRDRGIRTTVALSSTNGDVTLAPS